MLILASQSPIRKRLLANVGLSFSLRPAALDERGLEIAARAEGADAAGIATRLAVEKARAVAADAPGAWVIGADQTLQCEGLDLHKPRTRAQAAAQLERLKARTHFLHAGVALVRDGAVVWSHVDSAALTMRDFTAAERDMVLALEGDAVLGSVGAYRIEGPSVRLFDSVQGDYFTILGLPLLPLLKALAAHAPETLLPGERDP